MNLPQRFAQLKRLAGGRPEAYGWDHRGNDDIANDDGAYLSPQSLRIFSELAFCLELSRMREQRYDNDISRALDVIESALASDGALTREHCLQAEALLAPAAGDAKSYEVLYAGHAHIDMNWMWGWNETVAVTVSTFRTVLNLMNEYPGFTFSQSQASVYRIIEEYAPEMMSEIQARIREGRWEVTAGAWVECDKNMPSTESLIRHITETRAYLRDVWGVTDVRVDFSPDTFGHSRFIPEINTFGGLPYYYHCRAQRKELTLYRYRAPSGKEILVYREPMWYNNTTTPNTAILACEASSRCAGLKTSLCVYGVGDHGGGPTRRDIEHILEMQKWPVFPTIRFGTLHEFFRKAESVRSLLPVTEDEINAVFTGCYTTQSRIKAGNRAAETGLLDAGAAAAMDRFLTGRAVPEERFAPARRNVLFTHFHDILTGSCVQPSREYAMGLYSDALARTQTIESLALEHLSRSVDTGLFVTEEDPLGRSEGAGVGHEVSGYASVPNPERGIGRTRVYTVWNLTPRARQETVEIVLWDYAGVIERLEAVDTAGNSLPLQLADDRPEAYWDHQKRRVLVRVSVPPFGWTSVCLRERALDRYPTLFNADHSVEDPKGPVVLENSVLRAVFDPCAGALTSLTDKVSGKELLAGPAGLALIRTEKTSMSAWDIGRYLGVDPVRETTRVSVDRGSLRTRVEFGQKLLRSKIAAALSLDETAAALRLDLEVDWQETFANQDWAPLLTFRMPLKETGSGVLCDVPAGFTVRPAQDMDIPCQSFAACVAGGRSVALASSCKYGYRLSTDGVLSLSLINTAGNPDPYPERGVHKITLWIALGGETPAALRGEVESLMRPLIPVPTASHPGPLASVGSFLRVDAAHTVVNSVWDSDGSLRLTLYEAEGTAETAVIETAFPVASAEATDADGDPAGPLKTEGDRVFCPVGPYSLCGVRIRPKA